LAAGVASGEVILAVAVLSILLTAPLGAIGIMIFGERVLDYSAHSTYRFKDLREKLELPRVGEVVRSKRHGTAWKIIEEKEVWIEGRADYKDPSRGLHPIPAIYLRYWCRDTSKGPGTGRTMSYRYSHQDPSFHTHWEVLYDW
jgi:hypothetical protein